MKKILVPMLVVMVSLMNPGNINAQISDNQDNQATEDEGYIKTLMYHGVEDYDEWKELFDDSYDIRTQAGEMSYEVGTLYDDPGTAYIINEWYTIEHFKVHLSKIMNNNVGAIESPNAFILNKFESSPLFNSEVTTFMYHEVENFNTWMAAYDEVYEMRMDAGELSYEIGNFYDEPNIAYVLNEWVSLDDFHNFLQNSELRTKMEQGGVLEDPVVLILNVREKR
ncbi:MAG: hypothetical protein WD491_05620 [Balneolales bacterium]